MERSKYLNPDIKADHVDMSQIPKARPVVHRVRRQALHHAPGSPTPSVLYYNKKLFAKAGITSPPKTMSELAADTKKFDHLQRGRLHQDRRVHALPRRLRGSLHRTPGPQLGRGKWLTADGQSNVGSDPAFAQALTWQKSLVDWFWRRRS
ncbi:extracellular solute-binding protein [Streptomyces sp. L7]